MAHNEKRGREMRLKAKRSAKAERKRVRREQAGTGPGVEVVDPSYFFPTDGGGDRPPPPRPSSGGA